MARLPGTPTAPPSPTFLRHGRRWQTLEEHDAAEDAINLATFKRRHDETMAAAYRSAADAPTPAEARKILDQASSTVSTIDSPNPRIQQAYAGYYEGSQAIWGDRFARQAQGIKDKNLFEQSEQNIQGYIQAGDQEGAAKELVIQSTAFPELQAKNEQRISDIPFNTAFTKASVQINSGDPLQIRGAVEALQGLSQKGWRLEQVAAWNRLVKAGQGELEARQNDNYKAAHGPIFEMDAATTELEFYAASENARKAIEEADVNPQQRLALQDRWRSHQAKTAAPIPAVVAQAWTWVLDPSLDRAAVDKLLWDHAPQLGTALPGLVKANAVERNKKEAYNVQAAINLAVKKHNMADHDEADYKPWMADELTGKDLTLEQMIVMASESAVAFMAGRPKVPTGAFTELRIQETLGMLQRGGQYIDPETKEVIPFPSTRAMRDYLLGRLGPQWHLTSPEALKIVVHRAPLAFWNYQTEAEKMAVLDRARNLESAFWDGTVLEGDITEGDREVAVEIAPPGKPITAEQVRAFGEYLAETGTGFPTPPAGPSDEVLGEMGVPAAVFEAPPTAPERPPIGLGPELTVAGRAGPVPVVETDVEYDALPSGTVFVGPDGVTRRKP